MEERELLRRFEDLAGRCDRSLTVTNTGFLTPAEQLLLRRWVAGQPEVSFTLHGGREGCERQAAFFLPYYVTPGELCAEEYIHAVKITAGFGELTHRDCMGAVLGLGIGREWIGDILVTGGAAWLFCLPSVEGLLLEELTHVGRLGVRVGPCALAEVPLPERRVKRLSFTVKSPRLDAVAGSLFGLSRTAAAEHIRAGGVSLNYTPCLRPDAPIREGDVLSLRGRGKGMVTAFGARSRKDRLFVEAALYL